MLRCALAIVLCLAALSRFGWAAPVPVESFETGVGAWESADTLGPPGQPSSLCSIYPVARPAPRGGGRQSALVEFLPAAQASAWAQRAVNGAEWADNDATQLSFWVKGDGPPREVTVVLVTFPPGETPSRSYAQTLTISGEQWQRYTLRFFGFSSFDGQQLDGSLVPYVRLLRLMQTGSWPALRFYIDEIVAEPGPPPSATPTPTLPSIVIDFGSNQGTLRGQLGARLDPVAAALIDQGGAPASRVAARLKELAPCVVGLELDSYFSAATQAYDLTRLYAHLAWVESQGARWLLTLNPPLPRGGGPPGATQRELFRQTCSSIASAQATSAVSRYYQVLDDPVGRGLYGSVAEATDAYNELVEAIKGADPGAYAFVGGMGFAVASRSDLDRFLKGARRLDFLSYRFFSAHASAMAPATAFESAVGGRSLDMATQLGFREVRELARATRPALADVFITALGPHTESCPPVGDGNAYQTAAWLAGAALTASPTTDKLLAGELCAGSMALLDGDGQPSPLYWAAWMLRHWAPRGARLCGYARPLPEVLAAGVRTDTAANIVIAYAGSGMMELQARAIGLVGPHQVRLRRLAPSAPQVQLSYLSAGERQRVTLSGPGVAVLQFVPEKSATSGGEGRALTP